MTISFDSATPPAFDYSSRDFQSIREELISLVQARFPNWNPSSASDFGVVLLEAFALVGDNLSYYLDRIANESSITTAVQPENVFAQAALLGYTPALTSPAYVPVTFTNNGTVSQTILAGTQIAAQITQSDGSTQSILFETNTDQTAAPTGGTATTLAIQGVTYNGTGTGETLGISDGSAGQFFLVPRTPVIDGSVRVIVNDGTNDREWTRVTNLYDYSVGDYVFTVRPTAYGQALIQFGDGAYGAVPSVNYIIKAIYRIGGGLVGNVALNTITQFVSAAPPSVIVTNTAAGVGGSNAESLSSIRVNAPRTFAAARRGVTASDFSALATNLPYVAKASTSVTLWSAPTVYVAPPDDGTPTPGRVAGVTTSGFASSLTSAAAELQRLAVAGSTVLVSPVTYVPVTCKVAVTLLPTASRLKVAAQVKAALVNLYSYANASFAHTNSRSEILVALSSLPGVLYADVTDLWRNDAGFSTGFHLPVAAVNEILTLDSAGGSVSGGTTVTSSDLTVVVSGGIADLT